MRSVAGIVKILLYLIWCAVGIPAQWTVLQFTRGLGSLIIPLYWHKVVCAIFGIKVEIEGAPVRDRQVILVSNHLSYLDIEVFSRLTPWSFVAKAEVASWPLLGTLARLQQSAFTSRSRADALKDRNSLTAMLRAGKNLILFAEGTSSDGTTILPFKSSLLGAALEAAKASPGRPAPLIQPVTLAILAIDGRPAVTQAARSLYAWHGEMTMAPHLWAFVKTRGARIKLVFHPPIDPVGMPDRKRLALACHDASAGGMAEIFSSRGWLPAPAAVTVPST